MNEEDCICEQYELKKNSEVCTHFTGNELNPHHVSKCFRYCSYCEAKGMMQNEEPLKRVHNRLKQHWGSVIDGFI